MNPFASHIQKTIDIPFDPPNQVTIRRLSGRHLERASTAFINSLYAAVHARGGAAAQKDIQQLFVKSPEETKAQIAQVQADPLHGYDKYVVCMKGILAWTYPDSLDVKTETDPQGQTSQRVEAIEDLAPEALDFFATEIMRLTKPALFLSPDEQKAEQGNA